MLFAPSAERAPVDARSARDKLNPARLLQDLVRGRVGLSVTASNVPGRYVSLLLDVRPAEDCILLDELIPASGHLQMQAGMTLQVRSALAGVPLSFDCQVLAIDQDSKGRFYRATLPRSVSRRQRRQYFRVPADANRLHARLALAESHSSEADVVDLSAAGLCLRTAVSAEMLALATGSQLDCTLLPRVGEELATRIELRRLIEQPSGSCMLLGASIIELTPALERRLGRLVAELERDLARKRPREQ